MVYAQTGKERTDSDEQMLKKLAKQDTPTAVSVRVRLYSGKVVDAEITAITNQSAGRKVQILYGSVTTLVNPAQIIEVFKYH